MILWMKTEEMALGELLQRLRQVIQNIDEIMQQDSSPLCAADITPDLRKQFAFLSGGRGQNGSPIIVFPEFPAFGEIQEREFHNVLTYLTSVPSLAAAGVGFILVIDRRQDRWTAVKATLLRIAGSFPGNLQLVLVLRPTTLFQRALSDILFKFNKDEFKMKVPVIMISSVTELHSYVDRSQLTQDLGGVLEYCHEKWISHRTAIEGFAVMVKRTAQTLQVFGTELAETELPQSIQSTSKLLHTHTSTRDRMKDDMLVALDQGSSLLGSIKEPVIRDPEHTMNQDELENLATVQRLLSQLDETERAFDEFWARHQTKLEQCLLLRHFEHSFREVRALLEQVSEKLMAFSEVGISPAHADHIFKELTNHEEKACEVLDQALSLAHQGDELIQKSHYAQDSIQPKCSELRAVSEDLSCCLKEKKELLLKAMELHQSMERAAKWCDDGIYLLASQPVDKCQSHEGAESALRELERYLDTAEHHRLADLDSVSRDYQSVLNQDFRDQVSRLLQKQASMQEMFDKRRVSLKKLAAKQTRPVQPVAPRPEAFIKSAVTSPAHRVQPEKISIDESDANTVDCKTGEELQQTDSSSRHASLSEEEENLAVLRRHVMNELLETERAYAEELLCVLQGYASEMDNPSMAHLIPVPLQNKKDVLFGNMAEIYLFHKRTFLRELEQYTDCPELVGRCFLERMTDLQIYEQYCQNKPRSESLWRSCSDCAFFQECQRKLEHKLGLDSYLLKPVQRITKYQLLLKEMLKYSKGCEGTEDLQEALSSILGILKAVNDSMHLIAITGYEANLSDLGRLLMQGSFSVWTEHKKGHAKVKDLARFKPMQRHLFLHEKALLFCKRREESGEGYEKAPSYSFKQSLNMSAVGITENAKGDNKKFEIWCNSREEVYIVQAPTAEVKTTWVNEIRKVLTTQLEAYREASQQRASDQVFQFPPVSLSPFKAGQRSFKKGDDRKGEQSSSDVTSSCSPDATSSCSPKILEKGKEDTVTSPTCDRAASVRKRFTLQGFSNLKGQRESSSPDNKSLTLPMMPYSPPGSLSSPDHKTKRHEIKSDPTPFGFRGWTKASLSLDASEENDGYSSAEDPMTSDPEDETRKKVVTSDPEDQTMNKVVTSDPEDQTMNKVVTSDPEDQTMNKVVTSDPEEETRKKVIYRKYTVMSDYEGAGPQDLSVKSGDLVQLIKEGEEGLWFVTNLKTLQEGWLPAANLLTVLEESKSCQSLSSEGSGSGNLSASSSCSETYTNYSDIKP